MTFDLRTARGLSEEEAAKRLAEDGPNEIASASRRSLLRTVVDILREPMLALLVVGALLYFGLGEVQEGAMLAFFVFVMIGITLYQERKTGRALEALHDLTSPRALVIRDGAERRVPGRETVRGDLVVIAEGDRVPADGRLLDAVGLRADESLLTGESVPVRKRVAQEGDEAAPPGGDDLQWLFSGTVVVAGRGVMEVTVTGAGTEVGRIGEVLATTESAPTPLSIQVKRLVRVVATIGGGLSLLLVVVYGLSRGDWLRGLLAGVAMAMAVLPEEFPVVLTVFLALGAWRLSKSRVLTRHVPAVEALGAASVLCVDKTGTLTLNEMRISRLWVPGAGERDLRGPAGAELPEPWHALVELGVLASQRDPFDPMEKAFHSFSEETLAGTEHLHPDWTLERQYPLSPELLAMSHVWRSADGQRQMIAAKGAPEAIADLCHFDVGSRASLDERVGAMAEDGLRVLAVARAYFEVGELPPEQHAFVFELVGLVGLSDPVRPGVFDAVRECREAGMRVVVITGDYPATATAVARDVGFPEGAEVLTGSELSALSDDALRARLRTTSIIARAVPEHKLRIVEALQADGEVVAMTGDGVNDAPALRAAHIGVAMGKRGTDVAREAASLVITDDDFASIVSGVRVGRRIFDNLQKSMAYIVAVHVPIAGMSLIPVLLGWPLVLLPVHIVFLELVIDPACSIAFEVEPPESDVMLRPPRRRDAALIGRRLLLFSLLAGTSLFAADLGIYALARGWSLSEPVARALAFTTLLTGNLTLIQLNRSFTRSMLTSLRVPNLPASIVTLAATALLLVALFVPGASRFFGFEGASPAHVGLAVLVGVASVAWVDLAKRFVRRPA